MISRALQPVILDRVKKLPVLTVTGPRQSGKTTLVKHIFPNHHYVNLEFPDIRSFAQEDPRGFLNRHSDGLIIDEVQHVPELFSYVQGMVDEDARPGRFILTGSQNFALLDYVNQSLAGRTFIFTLLPLSLQELNDSERWKPIDPACQVWTGGYPRLYGGEIDPTEWLPSYIQTYVERDVRSLINVKDLRQFQLFLKLCAGRIGQLLNYTSLANAVGVKDNTIRQWLSILEASYILFLLKPYHGSFNKRLVKSPKLYFYDTGLACNLLGIQQEEMVVSHYLYGGLFENMVVTETMKVFLNKGKTANLYFWRDSNGKEIDLLVEQGENITPIEIKATHTPSPFLAKTIDEIKSLSKGAFSNGYVIYGGNTEIAYKDSSFVSWKNVTKGLDI